MRRKRSIFSGLASISVSLLVLSSLMMPGLAGAEELPACNAVFSSMIDQTGHYCNGNQSYRICGGIIGIEAGRPCRPAINPSMCVGEFYDVYCASLTENAHETKNAPTGDSGPLNGGTPGGNTVKEGDSQAGGPASEGATPIAVAQARARQASRLMSALADQREAGAVAMQEIAISIDGARKLASVPGAPDSFLPSGHSQIDSTAQISGERTPDLARTEASPAAIVGEAGDLPQEQSVSAPLSAGTGSGQSGKGLRAGHAIVKKADSEVSLMGLGPLQNGTSETPEAILAKLIPEFAVSTPPLQGREKQGRSRRFQSELGMLGSLLDGAERQKPEAASMSATEAGVSLFARIKARHKRFAASL